MGLEPQYEAEAPVASPEIPVEQPSASTQNPFAVTATSLDGFSLDDAATGHVHFASERTEVAHGEADPSAPAEEIPAAQIPSEPVPQVVYSEPAPEAAPEVVSAHAVPPEAVPQAAPAESAARVAAAPLPALDWDSFYYSIIRKVVVRMSPPVLPAEVVEGIARRLADEIAAEISSQSPPSPTNPE